MTIKECIDRVNNLYPNQYGEEIMVDWLSRLDNQIFTEVILTHEIDKPRKLIPYFQFSESPLDEEHKPPKPHKPKFKPYTEDNMAIPLLAPFPYDDLYVAYLEMKIDEANKETVQYNNSLMLFNSYYQNYTSAYNREHLPVNRARYNNWRVL